MQSLFEVKPDSPNAHSMIYHQAKLFYAYPDNKTKKRAIKDLRKFLKDFCCINALRHLESPVMRLAKEGKREATWLLLNYFMANLDQAAEGAAARGDIDFTRELVKLGASSDAVLRGLSAGGHFEFFSEFNHDSTKDPANAYNLALGGHTERLKELLTSFVDVKQRHIYAALSAKGAANSGNKELLDHILENEIPITDLSRVILNAMIGAFACEQNLLAEDLLRRLRDSNAYPGWLDILTMLGSVQNGSEKDLITYLERITNNREFITPEVRSYLLKSSSWAGHTHLVHLIEKHYQWLNSPKAQWSDIDEAISTAVIQNPALATHLKKLQLSSFANRSKEFPGHAARFTGDISFSVFINRAVSAQHFNCPERLLRYLVSINCRSIREGVVAAYKLLPVRSDKINIDLLLKEANKIELFMAKFQIGYWEAKAWDKSLDGWFLQGIQLVRSNKIPLEIFLMITSIFTGLPLRYMRPFFAIHCAITAKSLLDESTRRIDKKYEHCSFWHQNPEKNSNDNDLESFMGERKEALRRYQYRLALCN